MTDKFLLILTNQYKKERIDQITVFKTNQILTRYYNAYEIKVDHYCSMFGYGLNEIKIRKNSLKTGLNNLKKYLILLLRILQSNRLRV